MEKKIDTRFVKRVLGREWKEFEDIQDRVIRMRTRRVSGTLRNEFRNRKYSVSEKGGESVTASLQHPDYERFLDMKKDRITTRRFAKVFTDRDRITRKKGRNIHNKIIFGRLNPITFHLMHDLRGEVTESARGRMRK
jgi:hypothetical protein